MAIVKSNICNMCGGLLDIDIDRQVYICPFCGVTFDYEYFREDNVLDIARKSLQRREFGAAKDAYEYMLKKDPHNFEALRGLLLCENRWHSMVPILQMSEVHMRADMPALQNALNNCLPEYKEYFEKIVKATEIIKDHTRLKVDIYNITSERDRNQKRLYDISLARLANSNRFTSAAQDYFELISTEEGKIAGVPIYIGFLILLGFIAGAYTSENYWLMLIPLGVLIAATVIYNIRKVVIDKSLEASAVPVTDKIEELDHILDEKNTQANKLSGEYKMLTQEIVTMYPIQEDTAEEANEEKTSTENKKPARSAGFSSFRKLS